VTGAKRRWGWGYLGVFDPRSRCQRDSLFFLPAQSRVDVIAVRAAELVCPIEIAKRMVGRSIERNSVLTYY